MKNLDKNPKLVEVEYKASGIKVPKDWEYTEDFGKEAKAKEATGGFNWYYTIPITTVVMAAAVGITALLGKKRKIKQKGEVKKVKNNIKRILCVLMVGAVACGAWGCGSSQANIEPMEVEQVNTLTFDAIGGEDVMPIAGYYGPLNSTYSYDGEKIPNQITDEYFQMIADSGINLLNQSYTDFKVTPENVYQTLELGEKYGLGICVYDTEVTRAQGENALPLDVLAERINLYANYPAFAGLYIVDEPQWERYKFGDGNKTIDMFAPILANLSELGVYGYANAFPNHGEPDQNYTDYLTYFVESGNLPYLSYDTYIWEGGHTFENYFYNMSLAKMLSFQDILPCMVRDNISIMERQRKMDGMESVSYMTEQTLRYPHLMLR